MVFSDRWLGWILSSAWFPAALVAAVALKMVVVSDLTVLIQYNPHDDGLYVARAYHLLTEGSFGPYDARTLVKLPGMSFWLAGGRLLGVPYLWSINILYILAGCYLLVGALQCGAAKPVALGAFVLYLFNPITMGGEWIRVIREPLSTGLLVVMFASSLFILLRLRERRYPFGHLVLFSVVFALSLLLREEDFVLYAVLLMMGAAAWWTATQAGFIGATAKRIAVFSIVAVPLLVAGAANAATRNFIERHYGLPLLHDFTEGEFPRLIAAIRSIESKKDNRYVMVTQERLAKLHAEVPRLAPVINRLPPPGLGTYSCKRYKICTELANGWVQFWIKDAAWEAGVTPALPKAQEFFRTAREDIERACQEGRLKCSLNGSGLLPPFHLKWTRAYVQEFFTLLAMMTAPDPHLQVTHPERYEVDANFGRVFQFVTMTHDFDTQGHANREASVMPRYANPLASWRLTIGDIYRVLVVGLILLTAAAFVVRMALWWRIPPNAFSIIVAVFAGYALVRLVALSYAAVYFGRFDDRLMYSTHSFILLIGLLVIADAVSALRIAKGQRLGNG